jgi:hypothetical protein
MFLNGRRNVECLSKQPIGIYLFFFGLDFRNSMLHCVQMDNNSPHCALQFGNYIHTHIHSTVLDSFIDCSISIDSLCSLLLFAVV